MSSAPAGRANGLDAMRALQEKRGWLSDEDLKELATSLGVPCSELESIATFYNLLFRRPVGRHVILICDSVSCWAVGYEAVRRTLEERLGVLAGQTTSDGRFTLLPVVCLGACDRAPVLMIDGQLHGNVAPDGLDAILEKYP